MSQFGIGAAAEMLDAIRNGHGNRYSPGQYRELRKSLDAARVGAGNGELVKALAKSGVGYPDQADGTGSTDAELAPLVPESLDPSLVSSTLDQSHVRLFGMLPKKDVFSTVHRANRINQNGLRDSVNPFFAEGGAPPSIEEEFERISADMKYMGRKFTLTDVARMVRVTGYGGLADRGGLEVKTQNALVGLMGQIERQLFWSDSSLYSGAGTGVLGFDGLYRQTAGNGIADGTWYSSGLPYRIPSGDNYSDQRAAELDHSTLIQKAADFSADPIFGRPNVLFVSPKAYGRFYQQALQYKRDNRPQQSGFHFGPTGEVTFAGPYGPIPVKSMPLMSYASDIPSSGYGDGAASLSAITITATTPSGSANSQFAAGDAGDYIYRIVPVGDKGRGAAKNVTASAVVAGDKVQIDVQDAAIQGAGTGKVRYYEVYRSDKDGAASTAKWLWNYPTNTDGTSSGTRIVDENYHIPGTCPAFLLEFGMDTMYMPTLLPMTRRPLPSTDTTANMLLMTFATFFVKRPTRVFVFDNCAE